MAKTREGKGVRARALMVCVAALRALFGIWAIATAAFMLVQFAPGDPVERLLGGAATEVDIARVRTALGLDQPIAQRYWQYISDLLGFRLGTSFDGQSVNAMIGQRLPDTIALAVAAIVVTLVVSVTVGIGMAALTRDGRHPTSAAAFTFVAGLFSAIPNYVLAVLLVALFAVAWPLFPVAGARGVSSLVLPSLALGVPIAAILSRIIRVEALNVLQSDYVRLAYGKRLGSLRIYFRHVLPSVVTAALTIGGAMFGYLLGGSVIVENVFARPGLGTMLVEAIDTRNYPVLQATIILLGIGVLLVNTMVDLLIRLIDPRTGGA